MRITVLCAILPVLWAGPAVAASFSACVAGLKEAVVGAGVSRSVASRALDGAQPDEKVLRLSRQQPEFKTPIYDYFGFLIDDERLDEPVRRAGARNVDAQRQHAGDAALQVDDVRGEILSAARPAVDRHTVDEDATLIDRATGF